jgi:hypothetical protein
VGVDVRINIFLVSFACILGDRLFLLATPGHRSANVFFAPYYVFLTGRMWVIFNLEKYNTASDTFIQEECLFKLVNFI